MILLRNPSVEIAPWLLWSSLCKTGYFQTCGNALASASRLYACDATWCPPSSWLGTPYVARVASSLQHSSCLRLPSAGIVAVCYQALLQETGKKLKVLFILFHFCGARKWILGFVWARQVLLPLSYMLNNNMDESLKKKKRERQQRIYTGFHLYELQRQNETIFVWMHNAVLKQ